MDYAGQPQPGWQSDNGFGQDFAAGLRIAAIGLHDDGAMRTPHAPEQSA